jgi:hypothetical protein
LTVVKRWNGRGNCLLENHAERPRRCDHFRLQFQENAMFRVSKLTHQTAAFALAAMLVAGCSKNDDGARAAPATTKASAPTMTDARASNSDIAVNILLGVQQARDAIARKDKAGAMTHVDAASSALQRLALPLVPIYTELSQESFLAPIEQAKKESGNAPASAGMAQADASANQPSAMSNATENASSAAGNASAPLAVQSVTSGYTRVMLDTSVTRTQLTAAKEGLDRGDLAAADKSLRTIEQSVLLESSAKRLPLVRARENLTLASTAARSGNWDGAKAQLDAAAKSLADYATVAPPADVADVKVMQQQIASYAPNVASQHDDAMARINAWWTRVANLTDRQG